MTGSRQAAFPEKFTHKGAQASSGQNGRVAETREKRASGGFSGAAEGAAASPSSSDVNGGDERCANQHVRRNWASHRTGGAWGCPWFEASRAHSRGSTSQLTPRGENDGDYTRRTTAPGAGEEERSMAYGVGGGLPFGQPSSIKTATFWNALRAAGWRLFWLDRRILGNEAAQSRDGSSLCRLLSALRGLQELVPSCGPHDTRAFPFPTWTLSSIQKLSSSRLPRALPTFSPHPLSLCLSPSPSLLLWDPPRDHLFHHALLFPRHFHVRATRVQMTVARSDGCSLLRR